MKNLIISGALLLSSPAFAVTPRPGSDPTQCTVKYDSTQTLDLYEYAGDQVTIYFGKNENLISGASNDKNNLQAGFESVKGTNLLPIKANGDAWKLPPFQLSIRTTSADPNGQPLDYEIRYIALPPILPKPPDNAQTVQLAAANTETATDASAKAATSEIERKQTCMVVRYEHPDEDKAIKDAAAKASWQQAQHNRIEQKLRQQQIGPEINLEYDFQGDREIGPHGDPNGATITDRADIYDDGMTTVLHFPGNARMPTFYKVNDDGSDGAVINATVEVNGLVKLTGVFAEIRLYMDGTKALCIFNRHVADHNPQTGTTSANIGTEVTSMHRNTK